MTRQKFTGLFTEDTSSQHTEYRGIFLILFLGSILFEREKLEVKPVFSSNFNANTSLIFKTFETEVLTNCWWTINITGTV